MNKYIFEGKTFEETKEKALQELNVLEENTIIKILEEKQGLLNDIKKKGEEIIKALNLNNQLKQAIQNYESELTNMKQNLADLENENEELMEKMEDYDMIKSELNNLRENGGNFQFKQSNRTKMKIQLETLEMENKLLKERISKYEKV